MLKTMILSEAEVGKIIAKHFKCKNERPILYHTGRWGSFKGLEVRYYD